MHSTLAISQEKHCRSKFLHVILRCKCIINPLQCLSIVLLSQEGKVLVESAIRLIKACYFFGKTEPWGKLYAEDLQCPSTSNFQPSNFESKHKAFIKETQRGRSFSAVLQTCFIGRSRELERMVMITAGSEGEGHLSRLRSLLSELARREEPRHGALSVVLEILVPPPAPRDPKIRVPAHALPQGRAIYTGGRGAGMGCTEWGKRVSFA